MLDEATFEYLPVVGAGLDTDADGIIEIECGVVPAGYSWLVERLAARTSDGFSAVPGARELELHASLTGRRNRTTLRDYTPFGGEAAADEANPIRFWQGETVLARFSGLTAAVTTWASIYLQVRVVATVPSPPAAAIEAGGEPAALAGQTPAAEGWN